MCVVVVPAVVPVVVVVAVVAVVVVVVVVLQQQCSRPFSHPEFRLPHTNPAPSESPPHPSLPL